MSNQIRRLWESLRTRMTLSYVAATIAVVIALEVVLLLPLLGAISTQIRDTVIPEAARQVAQKYALLAAVQGRGAALDPAATFQPGQPGTLSLPGHTWDIGHAPYYPTLSSSPKMFVMVVTPDEHVLASSYPARFAAHAAIAEVLPARVQEIAAALHGHASAGKDGMGAHAVTYAAEPIWNWQKQPMGAVYVEISSTFFTASDIWHTLFLALSITGTLLLVSMIPIGVLFGVLTTRGTLRRIRHLADATSRFAAGDLAQRVSVRGHDEISQLEDHFNRMAAQLTENIALRQELASQNARLAERGRISRDLHDSIKQQVFAIGLQLGTALSLLERDPAVAVQHVRQADALAHQAQQELTTLIHELRPLALQSRDFSAALHDYVNAWGQQHGVATQVQMPERLALPGTVEDSLLRVTQEALANVARHSQARQVQVTLTEGDDQVTLAIADDGQGFTVTDSPSNGVGLNSMRERMQALGGTVTVLSASGQGTRILAQCPLHAAGIEGVEQHG